MIMKYEELKNKLLKTSKVFREEYLSQDLALDLAHLIAYNRVKKNWTQGALAKAIGTKQPGVARLERGNTLPSLNVLERISRVLGMSLVVDFKESNTKIETEHPYLPNALQLSVGSFSTRQESVVTSPYFKIHAE